MTNSGREKKALTKSKLGIKILFGTAYFKWFPMGTVLDKSSFGALKQ